MLRVLRLIRDGVTIVLFVTLFLVLLGGVVARYLLHAPIAWSDEFSVIVFVWVIFFTSSFSLGFLDHFGFDVVYGLLSPRMKRAVLILTVGATAAVLLYCLPYVWDYVSFMWRERTAALQWRFDYVYLCFPMFLVAASVGFICKLIRLLFAGAWEDEL